MSATMLWSMAVEVAGMCARLPFHQCPSLDHPLTCDPCRRQGKALEALRKIVRECADRATDVNHPIGVEIRDHILREFGLLDEGGEEKA